jgi:chorismate synthase
MASNSFGRHFRLTTFGESHGPAIGCILDGCPAGFSIDLEAIQQALDRRKPGQSAITSRRKESDRVEVLSGLLDGTTTGTPIALMIRNIDARSADYSHIADVYRPSHADFTWDSKFGIRDHRGGGRSSARETAMWVAAGAIGRQILSAQGVRITAYVNRVGTCAIPESQEVMLDSGLIDSNPVRCPDAEIAGEMEALIRQVRKEGDTVGGEVTCVISGCPAGWGAPVFQKLHADLGHAMLSINACKGFEYGSGFSGARMRGSQHNDVFIKEGEEIRTRTNYSGGIQGGITNGMDIVFRVAFKPVATLIQDQQTVNEEGKELIMSGKGRHDPCVVPRAVPIVEAMAALVLTDHYLLQRLDRMG